MQPTHLVFLSRQYNEVVKGLFPQMLRADTHLQGVVKDECCGAYNLISVRG
jgi:hypothetical protein